MEEREDRRARKNPDQLQQHFLAAARARQPVVDEGDPHDTLLRTSSYTFAVRSAARRHENSFARSRPLFLSEFLFSSSPSSAFSAAAIDATSAGSKNTAAPPAASWRAGRSEHATGVPAACASITGRPKPSAKDGGTSTRAPATRAATSSSGTQPTAFAPSGSVRPGLTPARTSDSAGWAACTC